MSAAGVGRSLADARHPHVARPGTERECADICRRSRSAFMDGDADPGWYSGSLGPCESGRKGRRHSDAEHETDLRPTPGCARTTGQGTHRITDRDHGSARRMAVTL